MQNIVTTETTKDVYLDQIVSQIGNQMTTVTSFHV